MSCVVLPTSQQGVGKLESAPSVTLDLRTAQSILRACLSTAAASRSTLSDGQQVLAWARVPAVLDALDAYFSSQGIQAAAPVALECPNTVAGALCLLALLWRGERVVQLPQRGVAAA